MRLMACWYCFFFANRCCRTSFSIFTNFFVPFALILFPTEMKHESFYITKLIININCFIPSRFSNMREELHFSASPNTIAPSSWISLSNIYHTYTRNEFICITKLININCSIHPRCKEVRLVLYFSASPNTFAPSSRISLPVYI